jgi:hypothetical protein
MDTTDQIVLALSTMIGVAARQQSPRPKSRSRLPLREKRWCWKFMLRARRSMNAKPVLMPSSPVSRTHCNAHC